MTDFSLDEAQFFLRTLHRDRVLFCTWCQVSVAIEDRPGAKAEAEAAHICGAPDGSWSVDA